MYEYGVTILVPQAEAPDDPIMTCTGFLEDSPTSPRGVLRAALQAEMLDVSHLARLQATGTTLRAQVEYTDEYDVQKSVEVSLPKVVDLMLE